jgi:hypothetical protein
VIDVAQPIVPHAAM